MSVNLLALAEKILAQSRARKQAAKSQSQHQWRPAGPARSIVIEDPDVAGALLGAQLRQSANLLALAEKILAQSRARKQAAKSQSQHQWRPAGPARSIVIEDPDVAGALLGAQLRQSAKQVPKQAPRQQAPRQQAKKHMPRDHIVRAGRGSSVPDLSAQLMSAAEPDWRSRASEIGQGVADEYGHEDPRWGFTGEGSEEDGTRAWNAFVAALEHSRSEMSDSMWRSRARKAFELVYEGYSPEEALGKAKLR